MCNRFILLYTWNEHNMVKQLYYNKKKRFLNNFPSTNKMKQANSSWGEASAPGATLARSQWLSLWSCNYGASAAMVLDSEFLVPGRKIFNTMELP